MRSILGLFLISSLFYSSICLKIPISFGRDGVGSSVIELDGDGSPMMIVVEESDKEVSHDESMSVEQLAGENIGEKKPMAPSASTPKPQKPAATKPQKPASTPPKPQKPSGGDKPQKPGAKPQKPAGGKPEKPTRPDTKPQRPPNSKPQKPAGKPSLLVSEFNVDDIEFTTTETYQNDEGVETTTYEYEETVAV